jgi:probable O-glycosylation ligase (exosortase A-associated)
MRYLQLEAKNKLVKYAFAVAIVLSVFSILGSQSRGAFLGIAAMGTVLIWKSPGRWRLFLAAAVLVPILLSFMPSTWYTRMHTIETYQTDGSAQGRINAWWFAFRLAQAHPFLGGGFDSFTAELFEQYAPDPKMFQGPHSAYFQILAEQSWLGLAMFLVLGWLTVRSCQWVVKVTRARQDLSWAGNLGAMIPVSFIGYAVSGAFLGVAYFDLLYHLLAIAVVTRRLTEDALARVPIKSAPDAVGLVGERPVSSSS